LSDDSDAEPDKPRKRKRKQLKQKQKQKAQNSDPEDSDFLSDGSDDESDSGIEEIIQNDEVGLQYINYSMCQLAESLPTKTVIDKPKRKSTSMSAKNTQKHVKKKQKATEQPPVRF
jgi:hypothetical protein